MNSNVIRLNPSVNKKEILTRSLFSDIDVLVQARLDRVDMQMLDKLVEGLGHLGIVTTTNKALGEVLILSTRDCWSDLKQAIEKMPFEIEFIGMAKFMIKG
jgi:hypothetical protein